jgi:hypothetical protein
MDLFSLNDCSPFASQFVLRLLMLAMSFIHQIFSQVAILAVYVSFTLEISLVAPFGRLISFTQSLVQLQ